MKWLLLLLLAMGCVRCGDPCKDLSQKICGCERTPDERQACLQRIATLASQRQNDADKNKEQAGRSACASLIDGCTCDKLAAGNLKACGLSTE